MAVLIINALINSICVKHQVLSVTLCNATAREVCIYTIVGNLRKAYILIFENYKRNRIKIALEWL